MAKNFKNSQTGFNLIEIMIVVAIIAIIAAIAGPSYRESARKSKRAEGKAFLLEVAQMQERHYTEFGRYATDGSDNPADVDRDTMLVTLDSGGRFASDNGHYTLPLNALGVADGTTFALSADPYPSGSDPDCGALTLNHLGQKSSGTLDPACW